MSYAVYFDESLVSTGGNNVLCFLDQHLTLEQNSAGKFEFTIPLDHPYYDETYCKKTEVRVFLHEEDDEPTFCGFITKISFDFYKQKRVTVTGDLQFLSFTKLQPRFIGNSTTSTTITPGSVLNTILDEHNTLVGSAKKKKFYVGAVDITDTVGDFYISFDSPLDIIEDHLIRNSGGIVYISYEPQEASSGTWYKKYVNYMDVDNAPLSNQSIKLGENLLDLVADLESDDIVTVAIPLGKKIEDDENSGNATTVGSRNGPLFIHGQTRYKCLLDGDYDTYYVEAGEEALKSFGRVYKVLNYERVTNPTTLYKKAKRYLKTYQYENLVIEATAIDLSMTSGDFASFKLNQRVPVISTYHGIDAELLITKIDYYLDSPEKNKITCGQSTIPTLTGYITRGGVAAVRTSTGGIINSSPTVPGDAVGGGEITDGNTSSGDSGGSTGGGGTTTEPTRTNDISLSDGILQIKETINDPTLTDGILYFS